MDRTKAITKIIEENNQKKKDDLEREFFIKLRQEWRAEDIKDLYSKIPTLQKLVILIIFIDLLLLGIFTAISIVQKLV